MTRSDAPSRTLDLDRDLPTTREDVIALRRARSATILDLEGYLDFLALLPPHTAAPPPRPAQRGDRPFELAD
jgi:hypothetical protein